MGAPPGGRGVGAVWLGAVVRILAFAGLTLLIGYALAVVAMTFGDVRDGAALLVGSSVTALAAILAGAVLVRYADGRPPAALGVGVSRMTGPHLAWGTLIGVAALVVAAAAMLATGSLRYEAAPGAPTTWLAVVGGQAVLFAVAAFAEEALFRGYPFQVLVRAAGPAVATVASSALFALAHAHNPEVGAVALLNIFLAGVLLAVAYLKTLSLWFATAVHLGWNWAMASLLDLPVSGLQIFDTPGYQPTIGGPDWWAGGAFGPEGGLVGTLGFAAALFAVLRFGRIVPDPAIAAAQPLVLDEGRTWP